MLPKQLRLSSERMRLILKSGRSVYSATLQCKFYYEKEDSPRFALIVPKKIVKMSTDRSRIKRLLRNALFELSKTQKFPVHGVFIVKRLPENLRLEIFKKEVLQCLNHIQ